MIALGVVALGSPPQSLCLGFITKHAPRVCLHVLFRFLGRCGAVRFVSVVVCCCVVGVCVCVLACTCCCVCCWLVDVFNVRLLCVCVLRVLLMFT